MSTEDGGSKTRYTLDANILIGMERNYPRDVFPSLWDALAELCTNGTCCVCSAIYDELNSKDKDGIWVWVRDQKNMVCEPTTAEFAIVNVISNQYPNWVQGKRNAGDPWIIAHAEVEESILVTNERMAGEDVNAKNILDKNQKIPNVAAGRGVHCMNFIEFARAAQWRF